MKKKAAVLLSITMLAGLLTGCGDSTETAVSKENTNASEETAQEGEGKESDQAKAQENADGETVITFSWWGGQERADKTIAAVELFMEKNPDIKVETSYYPFDSYYENISIAATSDNMPDVFQGFIGAGDWQQFMDEGLLESLDSYVEQGAINTDNISENTLATGIADGNLYGLALGVNAKCMYAAPDIYEAAGLKIPEVAYESWEALESDLEKIKETTDAYGADDFLDYTLTFPYYCRQFGESQYASEGNSLIGFSEDTYVNYYNMKLKWIEKGLIPPYDVTQGANGKEDSQFVKGKAGVFVDYTSAYSTIAGAANKELQVILLPGPDTNKGTDLRAGQHVCMSSKSNNKEAAARLIDFLINDIDGNKILNAERGIPASDVVREALMSGFDENQKKMAEAVELATQNSSPGDLTAMSNATDIETLMKELEEQIAYKAITPAQAYEQIAKAAAIE